VVLVVRYCDDPDECRGHDDDDDRWSYDVWLFGMDTNDDTKSSSIICAPKIIYLLVLLLSTTTATTTYEQKERQEEDSFMVDSIVFEFD
jgi:hypothetical protein